MNTILTPEVYVQKKQVADLLQEAANQFMDSSVQALRIKLQEQFGTESVTIALRSRDFRSADIVYHYQRPGSKYPSTYEVNLSDGQHWSWVEKGYSFETAINWSAIGVISSSASFEEKSAMLMYGRLIGWAAEQMQSQGEFFAMYASLANEFHFTYGAPLDKLYSELRDSDDSLRRAKQIVEISDNKSKVVRGAYAQTHKHQRVVHVQIEKVGAKTVTYCEVKSNGQGGCTPVSRATRRNLDEFVRFFRVIDNPFTLNA